MINCAELARPREWPILTDQQAQDFFRRQIEYIVGQVQFPIRGFVVDTRSYSRLFAVQGGQKYGLLTTGFGIATWVAGRVEADRSQELGFEVMKEFGFNPNVSLRQREHRSYWDKTIIEKTTGYPSQTIGGLVFDKVEQSYEGSERPFQVEWRARDAARRFRVWGNDKVKVA